MSDAITIPSNAYDVHYDHGSDGSVYCNYSVNDMTAPAQPGATFVNQWHALCQRDTTDIGSTCTVMTSGPTPTATTATETHPSSTGIAYDLGIGIPILITVVLVALSVRMYLQGKRRSA